MAIGFDPDMYGRTDKIYVGICFNHSPPIIVRPFRQVSIFVSFTLRH